MRWFRRSWDDFESRSWTCWDGVWSPVIQTPEPWRERYDRIFIVPVSFAMCFADKAKMNAIKKTEASYIDELRSSIATQGLLEPAIMYFDPQGKIRYQEGYHRLCALSELPYIKSMPVRLQESPRVRGYGRHISEEVEFLFESVQAARSAYVPATVS